MQERRALVLRKQMYIEAEYFGSVFLINLHQQESSSYHLFDSSIIAGLVQLWRENDYREWASEPRK